MTKEEQAELNSLIALEMLLEAKRDAYIEEHGCDAYVNLPSHQSFKLNYKKWKRLQDLKVLEAEHDFNNY